MSMPRVYPEERRAIFAAIIITIAILLLGLLTSRGGLAQQAGHNHPPQHAALHDQFYKFWMRPDNRLVSCCNNQDCAPTQAKKVGGQWFVLRDSDQKWLPVPPGRIETERDSPDGRSHACYQPPGMSDTVFCFIPGSGI